LQKQRESGYVEIDKKKIVANGKEALEALIEREN
jgi:hypothetical protein